MTDSIKEKFSEPAISQTFANVAENQAKIIIHDKLEPSLEDANAIIDTRTGEFEATLNEFTTKYDADTDVLADEIGILKQRNAIIKLGDEAIATAKAAPYDELFDIYRSTDSEYDKLLVNATIHRIKGQFAGMTRMANTKIQFTDPVTKQKFEGNKIPTEALIDAFPVTKNWKHRGRVLQLLASRKEFGVPECILNGMKDDHLEVRKISIASFERVTGWKSNDTFGYGGGRNKDLVGSEQRASRKRL